MANRTTTAAKNHLVDVKLALAAKYDRLALLTGSRPRRKSYVNRAERYRRQAAVLGGNE